MVVGQGRPDPDAPGKPTALKQITTKSWHYLLRRTLREFVRLLRFLWLAGGVGALFGCGSLPRWRRHGWLLPR